MHEQLQETYIRFVPAEIYAKAAGLPQEGGEEIVGHFLLKRQGKMIVLWEVNEFTLDGPTKISSIGPVHATDYHHLVVRNFRCS
jgi:hypothetical protein